MEEKSKVVKIIKRVVVGFFALVFVMGFFSKSIANMFLPRVTVDVPRNTEFSREIRTRGDLVAKETSKVKLSKDVMIEEVYVERGKKVEIGEPIFKINKKYKKDISNNISDLRDSIEDKQIELSRLRAKSYISEERHIEKLKTSIEKKKKNLELTKTLYDSGAKSLEELNNAETVIEDVKAELELYKINLNEKKEDSKRRQEDIERSIAKLKEQLNAVTDMNEFYSTLNAEGEYVSAVNGIVLSVPSKGNVYRKDEILTEIAKVEKFSETVLKLELGIEEEDSIDYNLKVKIMSEDKDMPKIGVIKKISKSIDGDRLLIEAAIPANAEGEPSVARNLDCRIIESFSGLAVDKSTVEVYGRLKPGVKGAVYQIVERDGILGKETLVRKIDVTIGDVGDDKVSITGLSADRDTKLVANRSYKIKNGSKVLLWD